MSADLLFSRQPGNANNDVVAIALLVVLDRDSRQHQMAAGRSAGRGALMVAGLAAGLALGTKLTVVPPVLALTLGVILIAGAGERLRAAAAWIGALAVGGGLWYARNLIVSGTPFPFVDIGPLTKPEELAGPRPLLDRPLPHRHRRLGPLLPPGARGAPRRSLAPLPGVAVAAVGVRA